ncbi:MAG: class I SAM-dependent methyltransferase [Candidatus Daviesbacteria bacterium]|nr:class I SAM-dependent methyltransferase [Candidatus Daviesbacteria bacterium]
MNKLEYQNIFRNEESHFFYISTHNLVLNFIKKYSPKKNLKILDAGCGTGLLVKKMAKFGSVYGVDMSSEAIKFCKKRDLRNIKKTSINKLPFKKNSFDIITCIDVLYHKQVDDIKALKEINRVLKPNGVLILKNPAFEFLKGHHDLIVYTNKRYHYKQIVALLKQSGFNIERVTYAFIFLFPIVLIKRILEPFMKNYSSDIDRVPTSLNKLLIILQNIEAKILDFINLPFGVSIYVVARKKV